MLRGIILALLASVMPTVANAGWYEAKSDHFIVYSEQEPDQLRAYATRLERFDQAVRAARGLADPKLTDANRLTVYVLRDQRAIANFAGAPDSGVHGFYIGRAAGPVAFVHRGRRSRDKWELNAETVFFHEYMHHLMLSDIGGNALPAWMTEGYAEFFATAEILDDGSVRIGAAPKHRANGLFNHEAYNATLSVQELVGATYKELDGAERESVYGKGWLLTHYMAFDPARRGQTTRYVRAIQQGQSPLAAAKLAFGDLGELDRNLSRYLLRKTLDVRVIPAGKIRVGPITVTPVPPGQAAAMEVVMQSQRGVDRRQASLVARKARGIAKQFPADPFVLAALAEAELDARQYAAAVAAADAALAIHPADSKALIMRGKAMMATAELAPAKADWKAIRSYFAKANRLDPEDAEPLVLYHETFRKSGQIAPKLAAEGLLYALTMVPQDSDVRRTVVRQLLADNKLTDARLEYVPIAYDPHQSKKVRAETSVVMAALIAGDGKSAAAEIDRQIAEEAKKAREE